MKTLVLGLGNDLYGDDGVGIYVVQHLRRELKSDKKSFPWLEETDFMESSLSGLSLLELVVGYEALVIVDTIKKENPVTGKIHLMDMKDLRHIPGPSPHYVSIPQILEIGKQIGLKVPSRIKIVAVEAKNMYNLGEKLSEEMKKRVPDISQKIKTVLKHLKN